MKLTCDFSVSSARHRPVGTSVPWYTPWNSPVTNSAPNLVLDFSSGIYGTGGASGPLDNNISFSRASSGSRVDQSGLIETLTSNVARIDHDPTTFSPNGLLLETTRTNLVAQSDAPVSQSITVVAAAHVVSFYGSGTVTLSGAFAAVQNGVGNYPSRSTFGFTPTAGSLTLTISGTVSFLQVEEGTIESSYIATTATPVTRSDDIADKALGPWFDAGQGTLVLDGQLDSALANDRILEIDDGSTSTRMSVLWNNVLGKPQFQVWQAGALQVAIAPTGNSIPFGSTFRVAIAYTQNNFAMALNGGGLVSDTSGVVSTGLTTLRIGRSVWGAQGLMHVKNVTYYPLRLSDAEVKSLSA